MPYSVYVIKNSLTDKIYIGQTSNLTTRIGRHNKLLPTKETSFTSKNIAGGKWVLVYQEEFEDRQGAKKREKELKSYRGRQFIKERIMGC